MPYLRTIYLTFVGLHTLLPQGAKMYTQKTLNHAFVIACIDSSCNLLRNTVDSIRMQDDRVQIIAVFPRSTDSETLESASRICSATVGGSTVTSLVNVGMGGIASDWAFIVFSGSIVRQKMHDKYAYYVDDERDILFPVAKNKTNFVDGTMNGMLVATKTFKLIGNMPEDENLEMSKAFWANDAIGHGCRFKAIVGGKIC